VRNLAAGADEQHPDAQGRITLSAEHRRYANLSKECVVIGSLGHLEIWDAQAWQQYQETHEETFSAASDDTLRDII
jgi:MraZ protein